MTTDSKPENRVSIIYPDVEDDEEAINNFNQLSMITQSGSQKSALANQINVNDPNPARKILQSSLPPLPITKPNEYLHSPTPYKADLYSTEDLNAINPICNFPNTNEKRKITWKEAFEINQKSSSALDIEFLIKFPTKVHQIAEIHWVDIVFALPNDIDYETDLVKHMLQNDNSIRMKLDENKTTMLFANVPNIKSKDTSIIPLEISIVKEHSDLPDDFQGILSTSSMNQSENKKNKRRVLWSQTGGIHNCATGVEANVHHLIAKKSDFDSRQNKKLLFLAEAELYNSADFLRWINVNRKQVYEEIENCTDKKNSKRIEVKCPPEEAIEAETILQATIISYKKQLSLIAMQKNESQPYIEQNKLGQNVFRLSKQVVIDFFHQIFDAVDQNRIMMRLDDLQYQLKPLRGSVTGMNRIKQYTNYGNTTEKKRPAYVVVIQMAFCVATK